MTELFAVIRVEMDWDSVYSMECIQTYQTELEAQNHVDRAKENYGQSIENRRDYVDRYFEGMNIVGMSSSELDEVGKQFGMGHYGYGDEKYFYESIKNILFGNNKVCPPLPDFNPPAVLPQEELHAVRILGNNTCRGCTDPNCESKEIKL